MIRPPDAKLHRTGADGARYLRGLLKAAGVSQVAAARAVGIDARTMRRYLAESAAQRLAAPYAVQYAVEALTEAPGIDALDDAIANLIYFADQLSPHVLEQAMAAAVLEVDSRAPVATRNLIREIRKLQTAVVKPATRRAYRSSIAVNETE